MLIKFRIRWPEGQTGVEVEDDLNLSQLLDLIQEKTGYEKVTLKYGWPPKDITQENAGEVTLASLKLKSENVLVLPVDTLPEVTAATATSLPSEVTTEATATPLPSEVATAAPTEKLTPTPEDGSDQGLTKMAEAVDGTAAEWPERGGNLILRVMPDDNSCLFTAFGGAVGIADPSIRLRSEVAGYIHEHPEEYNKVILDNLEPDVYIRRLLNPQTWGGAIELSILSKLYKIQICAIDVENVRIIKIGEETSNRCILIYSGLHYDRIAFVPEYLGSNADVAFDVTRWDMDDEEVLLKAWLLAEKLNKLGYYTNPNEMVWRCAVCDWHGQGQKDMVAHQKKTGHTSFEEVKIKD